MGVCGRHERGLQEGKRSASRAGGKEKKKEKREAYIRCMCENGRGSTTEAKKRVFARSKFAVTRVPTCTQQSEKDATDLVGRDVQPVCEVELRGRCLLHLGGRAACRGRGGLRVSWRGVRPADVGGVDVVERGM